jgi:hypothetical protein
MSIANGKYSLQTIVLRDTYSQLNNMWQTDHMNQQSSDKSGESDESCVGGSMFTDMITKTDTIISRYHQNSKNELVRVPKKYSVSGDQYYDPADMLESMRAFYHATPTIYQSLCDLIERNINALGKQQDKSYKCKKVTVNIANTLINVPVIPDDRYALIYQIIAEYSNTWL